MASVTVYDAIKAFAQTELAPYQVIDFDQVEDALVQGSTAFIAIEEVSAQEESICFGDPDALGYRETSMLIIHAFVPNPEGSNAARAILDTIRDAFRLQRISGVRVVAVTAPDFERLTPGRWVDGIISLGVTYDFNFALPDPV